MRFQVPVHHLEAETVAGPSRHPLGKAEHEVLAKPVGWRFEVLLKRVPSPPSFVRGERIGVRRTEGGEEADGERIRLALRDHRFERIAAPARLEMHPGHLVVIFVGRRVFDPGEPCDRRMHEDLDASAERHTADSTHVLDRAIERDRLDADGRPLCAGQGR